MNETKKALECCVNAGNCGDCPLNRGDIGVLCVKQNMINALELISRYEAEIERLKGWQDLLKAEKHSLIKAEAVKEFAKRIHNHCTSVELNEYIDSVVEEMVGEG